MRRSFLIAGVVVAVVLFAAIGASISLLRSIRSLISTTPSLALERSTAR
jgi:hypothetical protein